MRNCIGVVLAKSGMNQSDLAREVGINRSCISLFISNKSTPTLLTAFKIAAVLKCRVDELFLYFPPNSKV